MKHWDERQVIPDDEYDKCNRGLKMKYQCAAIFLFSLDVNAYRQDREKIHLEKCVFFPAGVFQKKLAAPTTLISSPFEGQSNYCFNSMAAHSKPRSSHLSRVIVKIILFIPVGGPSLDHSRALD